MAKKHNLKGDIVMDYMERFPEMLKAKKRLAAMIYAENPEVFTSIESVRRMIRYRTGAAGKANRKYIEEKDILLNKQFSWNKIPDGEEVLDWESPKVIEGENTLLMSDIHFPYHDKVALELALEEGYRRGVDSIVLNGDIMDCYQQSRWEKDPRQRDFAYELDLTKMFLRSLREEFPKAKIYFKWGNHEVRYELYMISKAPALLSIPNFELSSILEFEELGIEEVKSMHWMKYGKLSIFHGHETGKGVFSPVNAARGQFLKTLESCISGHYHQPSTHTQKTGFSRKPITVWSIGCLCKLSASGYSAINKWSHGFALLRKLDERGNFEVMNKRIYQGQIWQA